MAQWEHGGGLFVGASTLLTAPGASG